MDMGVQYQEADRGRRHLARMRPKNPRKPHFQSGFDDVLPVVGKWESGDGLAVLNFDLT
jgi:hypothetical protein